MLPATPGCQRQPGNQGTPSVISDSFAPPAIALARGDETTMSAVRFLEDRVKSDPDDIVALNKLSGYYLQLHRETDEPAYLELALHAAQASLRVVPADQNLSGLRALAQAELETHDFVSARQHARDLTEYEPQRSFGFQLLGDALMELGDYDGAARNYERMEQLDADSIATQARLANFDLLHGNTASARKRYQAALNQARASSMVSSEITAWCHWRLGEVEMATGQYQRAEFHFRNALATVKDYSHALASLARLRAARGDLPGAIEMLETVAGGHSDPADAAALGDLYQLAGRASDAEQQYSVVERLSQQSKLHSALYHRHLALFWADHDRNLDKAYELARKEYETRRDIYGADVLAWAAFKAGKIQEAETTIKEALRLGTQDARLFYHAGMIARAAGDQTNATDFLRRAIKLNPHFDPRESVNAARALKEITMIATR